MTNVALVTLIVAAIGGLAAGIVVNVLSREVEERADFLPRLLLRIAVRRVPAALRVEVHDEWLAELHAVVHGDQRPLSRAIRGCTYALGLVRSGRRTAKTLGTTRSRRRKAIAAQVVDVDHREPQLIRIRALMHAGPDEALAIASRLALEATEAEVRNEAILLRLSVLLNLDRTAECRAGMARARQTLTETATPSQVVRFHTLAGFLADRSGSTKRARMHADKARHVLADAVYPTTDTSSAWHNLAMLYSCLNADDVVAQLVVQGIPIAQELGLHEERILNPMFHVRRALRLDYHGDTNGCIALLDRVVADFRRREVTGELDRLTALSLSSYAFAAARRVGMTSSGDIPAYLRQAIVSEDPAPPVRGYARVCLDLADDKADNALERLGALNRSSWMDAAEIPRLRALALLATGDGAGACESNREAYQLALVHIDGRQLPSIA